MGGFQKKVKKLWRKPKLAGRKAPGTESRGNDRRSQAERVRMGPDGSERLFKVRRNSVSFIRWRDLRVSAGLPMFMSNLIYSSMNMNTQNSFRAIFGGLTILAVLAFATPTANATTLTWTGGQSNSSNVSGTANWLDGAAPANDTDYHFVFDAANLVPPGTNVPRTTAVWNRNPGFLSLTLTGNATYPAFTLSATNSLLLTFKGNVTVTSGDHILNSTITVANDATWNIGANSSLARSGGNDLLTLAADRTITKTGDGMLSLNVSNTALSGTIEVQQGVLRIRNENNTLGNATVALNGGLFEIFANNGITSTNATTSVIGESTVQLGRSTSGAGVSNTMGALQLGSSKLTVTANNLNTSGTANVIYGATTLSNNATLEVVNNGLGATTQVTLGAVGDSGGDYGLTKTGSGVLVLDSANTYTGNTTVSAGTLLINGSTAAASTVIVGAGAVIGGNGTINGDLSLANGAFVAFDPNFTLTLGGFVVGDPSFGVASLRNLSGGALDWDTIDVGTYTLITGVNLGPTYFNDTNISNFGFSNALTGLGTGGTKSAYFQNGSLQLVVIPEPTTWALLAGSLTALVIFRRRRGTN
jgi:autotransporter-associated beta strand protein